MTEETKVEAVETVEEASAQEVETKTFTQEEVNRLLADRVAREKKNFAKELAEKDKMAKMDAEQKLQYEQDKLAERERELNRRELLTEAKTLLTTNNFSTEIADFIIGEDLEETTENFNKFDKLFKEAVEKGVEERFKTQGRNVKTSIENTQTTIDIAAIAKKHRKR